MSQYQNIKKKYENANNQKNTFSRFVFWMYSFTLANSKEKRYREWREDEEWEEEKEEEEGEEEEEVEEEEEEWKEEMTKTVQ